MYVPLLILVIVGLVLGPLAGVAVDRTVEKLSWRFEHRCVHCKQALGLQSLIPISHWFDNCSSCSLNKGMRYFFVDITLIFSFLTVYTRFGFQAALFPYLFLALLSVILSFIDFETHLLPNRIVWPAFAISLLLLSSFSFFLLKVNHFPQALIGAAVFSGFLLFTYILYPQGMGFGDIKLALILGLYIGLLSSNGFQATQLVLYTVFVSLLSAGIIGVIYSKIKKVGLKAEIPFGPFLMCCSLLTVVFSKQLLQL